MGFLPIEDYPVREHDPAKLRADEFWVSVRGDAGQRREVLARIMQALRDMPGVKVIDGVISGDKKNGQ